MDDFTTRRDAVGFNETPLEAAEAEERMHERDASSRVKINRAALAAHRAVDRAADAAVPAAQWLNQKSAGYRVKQKKVLDDTSAYVSANPLKSVGIAALVGLVIGLI